MARRPLSRTIRDAGAGRVTRVVVLGAGIYGRLAQAGLQLDPSNIWVGVGLMQPAQVTFPLAPVNERHGIEFIQAPAREIHPEGDVGDPTRYVTVEPVGNGSPQRVPYDFLINATGPKLRFDKTEGLGPGGHSLSVCAPEWSVSVTAPAPASAPPSSTSSISSSSCAPARCATGPRSSGSPTSTSWATSEWAACTSSEPATSPQQHLQRLPVRRARHRLDHPRPRQPGRGRPRPLRNARRRPRRADIRF